jgi:uncharacterized protein (TIGR03437 family)
MRISAFSLLIFTAAFAAAQGTNPSINSGGIVNAADAQGPLAPGSLFSIFGSRLSSQTANALSVPLSSSLGGVTVQFVNGSTKMNAPMLYVQPDSNGSASQINAQVPWNLVTPGTTSTVNVIVSHDGVSSTPTPVMIGPYSPGIFASGSRAVAVNYPDGTLAWPANSVAGLNTHPAKPGSTIIVYATGLGALNQSIADGAASLDALRTTLTQPVVLVGGLTAQIQFSGLSPQFVGVNQLNIVVPNAVAGDAVPIQIQVGGITSPATTTIAVGN